MAINTLTLEEQKLEILRCKAELEKCEAAMPEIFRPYMTYANAGPWPGSVLPQEMQGSKDWRNIERQFYNWQICRLAYREGQLERVAKINKLREDIGAEVFDNGTVLYLDLREAIQRRTADRMRIKITDWPLNSVNWAKAEKEAIKSGVYKQVIYDNNIWFYFAAQS